MKDICKEANIWHERQHKKNLAMTLGIFLGIFMGILVYLVSSRVMMGLGIGAVFALIVFSAFYGSVKRKEE